MIKTIKISNSVNKSKKLNQKLLDWITLVPGIDFPADVFAEVIDAQII